MLDEISHRSTLLEAMNARLEELTPRLTDAVVDREAVAGVARNLTEIASAMADRFEAMEARLAEQERRLTELLARAESKPPPA